MTFLGTLLKKYLNNNLKKKWGLSGLLVLTLTLGVEVDAKEMPQRLGLGIKDNISQSLPSLAIVYHLDGNSALTGGFGLDTQKNNSSLQFHMGVRYVVFQEKNMHFYSGGQLGYLNYEQAGTKESGMEVNLVGGAEFFFEGLENLGWTLEGGFGISTAKDTRVRTIADSPFKAGMIFYF